ncbi:hypothetical protein [Actinacidiphila glaucinigra]|uniref:hypothetical protein n=1 Tax=Actinacidiphila glaucinigra TaxID=235986 RepID=UPI00381FF0E6
MRGVASPRIQHGSGGLGALSPLRGGEERVGLGRTDEVSAAYRQARERTRNEAERAFLTARLTERETPPA